MPKQCGRRCGCAWACPEDRAESTSRSRLGLPAEILDRARGTADAGIARGHGPDRVLAADARPPGGGSARSGQTSTRTRIRTQDAATEWVERQKKRIAELERKFAEAWNSTRKKSHAAIEAVKERELRAWKHQQQIVGSESRAGEAAAERGGGAAFVGGAGGPRYRRGARERARADGIVDSGSARARAGVSSAVTLRRRDESNAKMEAGPLRDEGRARRRRGDVDGSRTRFRTCASPPWWSGNHGKKPWPTR